MSWWVEILAGLFLIGAGFVGGAAFATRTRVVDVGSPEHLRDLVAHYFAECENATGLVASVLVQRDTARAERDEARRRLRESDQRAIDLLERLDLAEGAGR